MSVSNTELFFLWKTFSSFISSLKLRDMKSPTYIFPMLQVADFAVTVINWIWWQQSVANYSLAQLLICKDLQNDSCKDSNFGGPRLKLDLTQTFSSNHKYYFPGFASSSPLGKQQLP